MRLIEQLIAHLHPLRQVLFHTDHQRRRRQPQRGVYKQRIVKPGSQLRQRFTDRRRRDVHPFGGFGDAALLHQELQAEQ
ncbi:hypothetical protein D3C73_1493110 [compost metagenome]